MGVQGPHPLPTPRPLLPGPQVQQSVVHAEDAVLEMDWGRFDEQCAQLSQALQRLERLSWEVTSGMIDIALQQSRESGSAGPPCGPFPLHSVAQSRREQGILRVKLIV